jgi:elongation factor Ts
MAITAKEINELRQRTGLGMNECKQVLTEANGDINAALDTLRKKGVKASIAARAATEGKLYVAKSADGKTAAIVEVLCNTDFTARSESIQKVLKQAADALLADPKADLANDASIKDALVAVSQSTGENVTLGRTKVLSNPEGQVGTYIYSVTNKIGVLASVTGTVNEEVLNDLSMHITAFKPVAMGMSREHVPADLVAKELEIAIEQAKATGKPQEMAEKIANGKMNSFYKERVLGEQDFINADKFKGSINDMLKKSGATLKEYVRLEVGVA